MTVLIILCIEFDGDFQQVERLAGIPVGELGQKVLGIGIHRHADFRRALFDNLLDFVYRQGFQHKYAAARQQGGDDLKAGVLGGRADQDERAILDIGQQKILLGFVEAVNFVQKQDGAAFPLRFALIKQVAAAFRLNLIHDVSNLAFACRHRRQFKIGAVCLVGDDTRQRGFADSRRPPEDHGVNAVLLDRQIQRFASANKMLLADKLVERLRDGHGLRGVGRS